MLGFLAPPIPTIGIQFAIDCLTSFYVPRGSSKLVEPRGVEPRFSACKAPVLPLNDSPMQIGEPATQGLVPGPRPGRITSPVRHIGFEPIHSNEDRVTACRNSPTLPMTHVLLCYYSSRPNRVCQVLLPNGCGGGI